MNTAGIDFSKLSRVLTEFAQELLQKQGEFYPFAATMDNDGAVNMLSADISVEHPTTTELLTFLSQALRVKAMQGGLRACGVCLNVGARLPGYANKVDAICCQLEATAAQSVQIFVPFHRDGQGRFEFDKPVALPGQASIFNS